MPHIVHSTLEPGTVIEMLNGIKINLHDTDDESMYVIVLDDWKSQIKVTVPITKEQFGKLAADWFQQSSGITIPSKIIIPGNGES